MLKKLTTLSKSIPEDVKIKWAELLNLPYADQDQLNNITIRVLLCISLANSITQTPFNVNISVKDLAEELTDVNLDWDYINEELASLSNINELYNKVLHENRYDGSFYTLTHAATLLSGLALSDPPQPIKTAVDFSCGTGILLSEVHKTNTEIKLHGFDISKLAAVITDALLYLSGANREVYLAHFGSGSKGQG